eukprot:1160381-Pelagomonas_calceolata.AAC.8
MQDHWTCPPGHQPHLWLHVSACLILPTIGLLAACFLCSHTPPSLATSLTPEHFSLPTTRRPGKMVFYLMQVVGKSKPDGKDARTTTARTYFKHDPAGSSGTGCDCEARVVSDGEWQKRGPAGSLVEPNGATQRLECTKRTPKCNGHT